jgi:mRNA interferase YafQ
MRTVKTSANFNKVFLKKCIKDSLLKNQVYRTMKDLSEDIFKMSLKTHKLSGKLDNFYSARVNFNWRVIFTFDDENIYLDSVGSHDEIY